ncbi:TetR/AcrR family transcriptional regulator [Cohnella sp. JJ-181]|uniref:TetR/AcrR family transcriptional regulator n=1 Tax=Cohnella rhizoplanae TaxID=2974897 RepID=UPI0022FFA30A|nr:TetR/AcrR family transcriptional regulator [Cohnella sp. JJ-181]CAI6060818.1 DNA-binding transcriptional repressor TetR [Cohnella sp. JJ-181]
MAESKKEQAPNGGSGGTRRRGDVLENAILQAAWDELVEGGYNRLTMEAVAVRAQTNKTAVYRRWPNKAQLVIAALVKFAPKPSLEAADTGDLRTDVLTFLQGILEPLQAIGPETIHGLMSEYPGKEHPMSKPLPPRSEDALFAAMKSIVGNAEKRGELQPGHLSERVISLPIDLLRYEMLTTHGQVSEDIIVQIVDELFLPLVRAKSRAD